jgi:hypothetical protein
MEVNKVKSTLKAQDKKQNGHTGGSIGERMLMLAWPPASAVRQADPGRPDSPCSLHFNVQNYLDFISGTTIAYPWNQQLLISVPSEHHSALKHPQSPISSQTHQVSISRGSEILNDSVEVFSLRASSANTKTLSGWLETEPDVLAAAFYFQLTCSLWFKNASYPGPPWPVSCQFCLIPITLFNWIILKDMVCGFCHHTRLFFQFCSNSSLDELDFIQVVDECAVWSRALWHSPSEFLWRIYLPQIILATSLSLWFLRH